MKRKIFSMLLSAVMCLSLCSCAQSEAAKSVDNLIRSIGEITLDSEAQIVEAEKAVAQLEEKDYKQIMI